MCTRISYFFQGCLELARATGLPQSLRLLHQIFQELKDERQSGVQGVVPCQREDCLDAPIDATGVTEVELM